MQGLQRRCLPIALALLVALALVPLAPGVAAASTDYAAACGARLRMAPSTSAATLVTMPTGTIVTTTGTVPGESWSDTCVTPVSGSTWYEITAVDGTSVQALYGVSVAYAATGLFQPSTAPPPTPAVYLEGIDVSKYQTRSIGPGRRRPASGSRSCGPRWARPTSIRCTPRTTRVPGRPDCW